MASAGTFDSNAPKKKKPADPWAGAAHGTGGFGVGSTAALQNFVPQAATVRPSMPAPSAPGPTAPPVDPLYDRTVGGLTRTRDDTLAALTGQRTSGLLGYGYTAAYGGDGLVQALAYDPNNPYSQAALARTFYQQSKTGTTNSMAARGQLNSGATINAQNDNDTSFNVGEDARTKGLIAFLNGLTAQEKGAKDAYDFGINQADSDRLGRAPTNPNYTPTTPDEPGAPAAPAGASTADLIKQWASQQYTVQPGKNSKGQSGVWHTYPDGRRVFVVGAVR